MEFISIGPYCDTAILLKKYNYRNSSYPFDWIFSSFECVKHCLEDNFITFLDKNNYIKGTNDQSTKHIIYNNYLYTQILRAHHNCMHKKPIIIKNRVIYNYKYNTENINFFNHHNLIENDEHYQQMVRRCNRLMELIKNNKQICFVYYNCYNDEINNFIEFSKYCEKYKNIYVLGLHKNNREQTILYKNSNCIIYQNYDIEYILTRIKKLILY